MTGKIKLPYGTTFEDILGKDVSEREPLSPGEVIEQDSDLRHHKNTVKTKFERSACSDFSFTMYANYCPIINPNHRCGAF
jgi:hypothetical protein